MSTQGLHDWIVLYNTPLCLHFISCLFQASLDVLRTFVRIINMLSGRSEDTKIADRDQTVSDYSNKSACVFNNLSRIVAQSGSGWQLQCLVDACTEYWVQSPPYSVLVEYCTLLIKYARSIQFTSTCIQFLKFPSESQRDETFDNGVNQTCSSVLGDAIKRLDLG